MTVKDDAKRLIEKASEDIITLEDGYRYFFPSKNGALNTWQLRTLADHLDELNLDWDIQVESYFENEKLKNKERPNEDIN